ncbi:MAG TPA: hypothetical protein VGL72_08040 [Bryobacteraceae bacterium]|jgi:hypothetical protein
MYHVLLLLFSAAMARAQAPELTAEQVAAKTIEAMGSEQAFAGIDSLRLKGRMRFGQGEFTPFTAVAKRPNRFRMELAVGQDQVTQAYDGSVGWQSVSGEHKHEPTALTGDSLAHLIDQAANAIGGPLLDRGQRRNKIEMVGREEVDRADCYKIKVTLGTGDTMVLFINPLNFRDVQEELPMQVNGKTSVIQESVSLYRKFGPILMACQFVTREKGGEDRQQLEIDSVEINATAEDSIFKMPVKE